MIEAEHFQTFGGWVTDSQFIDLMGSAYLLANGMGTPVKDAVTVISLPAPGRYRVWIRTRDWAPRHHPGRFEVLVDGIPLQAPFGASGTSQWHWEDGGTRQLGDTTELRLRDLTGYYGRCDVILLTADPEFRPPNNTEALATLRIQCGALSPDVFEQDPYDIVVVGGGLAGCTAAVAAARNGARVALVQNRPVLGGNASSEILVPPVGAWNSREEGPFEPRETGLIEEFRTAGRQRTTEAKLYTSRLHRFVEKEPRIDLFLDTHATGVRLAEALVPEISSVQATVIHTGERLKLTAKLVLDCSGDSQISVSAGADFRQGKEARHLHHEPWAPPHANPHTMGNSLKYYPRDTGRPCPFNAPPWAYTFPSCDRFGPGRHPKPVQESVRADGYGLEHQWMLELGGKRDTYADAEDIRDDLFRLIYGIWDHIKNHCDENAEHASTYELGWVSYVAGKRENRRLLGDVVLTQNDIIEKTPFPDAVAYGDWVNDDHYSEGFWHTGSFGSHYDDPDAACYGEEFSIPFRCLYSRNVNNLMMAGRNISATHMAMSNTRVMITCALTGHAAGTAAALCARENLAPRELYRSRIDQLQQQLLKEGAYIIGLRADDPYDLARSATVSASSEHRPAECPAMVAANVVNGWGRAVGNDANAWQPAGGATGPHWLKLVWKQPVRFNVVHVNFQTVALAPRAFSVETLQNGTWRPVVTVTENNHRRHVLGIAAVRTAQLRIVTTETTGISEIRVYDEMADVVRCARRAHATMREPDRSPLLPWETGERMPHVPH